MPDLKAHLRKTLLTGLFAFVPLAVTVYIIWLIDQKTLWITDSITTHIPLLRDRHIHLAGLVITIVLIYIIGLIGTSLAGRWFLRYIDTILLRLPILRPIYTTWKQVALTPGGTEGVFSRVVLVPETENLWMIGFTSLRPLPNDPDSICVLVFNAPTPTTGRMYFVRRDKCRMMNITAEEAFKIILSAGNYVAPEIGAATASSTEIMSR
jgi:uncharacterized membrane protein